MAKLKLPFELEKPSADEYVTRSNQIGHGDNPLDEVLDDFGEKVGNTEEDGYYLCDSQGNVVMRFTEKGFDAAKVNPRLRKEEFFQSNTEEEGFYLTDTNGNYIFLANSNGVNMKVSTALLNWLKSHIEGGGGGGTSYDSIGYPVLDDTNPLAMLIRGRSRARLFKSWGVVGASFETGLIECYDNGTATNMTDTGNDWPSLFGEMNSVDVGNYAIAGSTLRNWLSSANGWTKLNNDTAKQAYLVNMSSNDNDTNKYNEPIGDITTDIDYNNWQNNAATWVGCLATIIQRIREKSPRCYIFLATRRNASGAKSNTRANQMCQALRQVCTCFPNVYLVDMWEYGANWDDTNFKKEFRCGGHPNRNGHIYLADAFNTYFDWIIRNNPIGMRDAAFIGTDYQDKDNY